MKKFFNVIFLAIVFCTMLLFTGCSSKKYDVCNRVGEKYPLHVEENSKGLFLHIDSDCEICWINNSGLQRAKKNMGMNVATDDDSSQNSSMDYTIYDDYLKTEKRIDYAIRVIDYKNNANFVKSEDAWIYPFDFEYYEYKKGTIIELKNDDKNYDKKRHKIKNFVIGSGGVTIK